MSQLFLLFKSFDKNFVPFSFAAICAFTRNLFFFSLAQNVFQKILGRKTHSRTLLVFRMIVVHLTRAHKMNIRRLYFYFYIFILRKVIEILIIRQIALLNNNRSNKKKEFYIRLNRADKVLVCVILTCCTTVRL